MQCNSFEKEVRCPDQATVEVFWPGKTTAMCDRHAQGAARVASAMGFNVDMRPIAAAESS
jgi:hypothetical protein